MGIFSSSTNTLNKINFEDMQNLIRLVKSNADNNLILLKEILRLKKQVEELEKKESEVVNVV